MTMPRPILILGGVRSGKSDYAEKLCQARGHRRCYYLATAEPADDPAFERRIAAHRKRRSEPWHLVEEPLDLAAALDRIDNQGGPDDIVLIECLSVWIGNLLHYRRDIAAATAALMATLDAIRIATVFVSTEGGLGIAPQSVLVRDYLDHIGDLHQQLAARADSVILVVAGRALTLPFASSIL